MSVYTFKGVFYILAGTQAEIAGFLSPQQLDK